MRRLIKKTQYSKLIVSTVVLLYFLLIPYSLVYCWKFEANTVLITILTTIGGIVAVVCNGYMNKSRFENVVKIQKALDKSADSTEIITKEIRDAVKEELKNALKEDITKMAELKQEVEDITANMPKEKKEDD
jgi:uncharacterized membrane protein YgaE (UPF0421/DUF939 family)